MNMKDLKTMMLVTHTQKLQNEDREVPTFRMIPVSEESPFLMAQFDINTNKLVLSLKHKKEELQTVPKMAPSGEYVALKNPKAGNPPYEFERRMIPEWHEIHVQDMAGIDELIKNLCINSETYKYQQYLAQINVDKKPSILTLS